MSKNFVDLDNAVDLMNGVSNRIVKDKFIGTLAQWQALTAEEKAVYDQRVVNILDDLVPSSGGGGDTSIFVGTTAAWNALPAADKAKYPLVALTDDADYVGNIVDEITDGEMSAVTSNAVYDLKTVVEKFVPDGGLFSIKDYEYTGQIAVDGVSYGTSTDTTRLMGIRVDFGDGAVLSFCMVKESSITGLSDVISSKKVLVNRYINGSWSQGWSSVDGSTGTVTNPITDARRTLIDRGIYPLSLYYDVTPSLMPPGLTSGACEGFVKFSGGSDGRFVCCVMPSSGNLVGANACWIGKCVGSQGTSITWSRIDSEYIPQSSVVKTYKGVGISFIKVGNVVHVNLGGAATADIAANEDIFTLTDGFATNASVNLDVQTPSGQRFILASNKLRFGGAVPTGTNVRGSLTYGSVNLTAVS